MFAHSATIIKYCYNAFSLSLSVTFISLLVLHACTLDTYTHAQRRGGKGKRGRANECERERGCTYLLLSWDLVLDVELNSSVIHLFAEKLHRISGPVIIVRGNDTGEEVLLGLGRGAVLGETLDNCSENYAAKAIFAFAYR